MGANTVGADYIPEMRLKARRARISEPQHDVCSGTGHRRSSYLPVPLPIYSRSRYAGITQMLYVS